MKRKLFNHTVKAGAYNWTVELDLDPGSTPEGFELTDAMCFAVLTTLGLPQPTLLEEGVA